MYLHYHPRCRDLRLKRSQLRWSLLIGIIVLLFFLAPSHFASAANILNNPGFESDQLGESQTIVNWTWYGQSWGDTFTETGPLAHSGSNYFKAFGQFITNYNYTGIFQDNPSAFGATYSADGWAYSLSTDEIRGQDVIWLEVTFRDATNNVLALYRSDMVSITNLASYGGPNVWIHLPITNKCSFSNTGSLVTLPGNVTNTSTSLVAPAGTTTVRYQIVFEQGPNEDNGSMYFDDCSLNWTGGTSVPPTAWNIVWSDEFNGTNINPAVWTYDTGGGGWGNNELETYTSSSQNSYVSNGLLHIVARQNGGTSNYTSARMKTQGLYSKTYGRFEWRAKLPAGVGFWPALWMLGTNINSVSWPGCGEIDVMENNGSVLGNVQGSLHSGSDETAVYTLPNGGSATNFHTYMLEWTPDAVKWYVDSDTYYYETQTGWYDALGNYPTPFNQPFFIIMNVAVGGNYLGNPSTSNINANSTFPGDMQVDYIRIYDQTPLMQITPTVVASNMLRLTWPTNIVCHLQTQTNSRGLSANWTDLPGTTSPYFVTLSKTNTDVFYRLASP